MNWYFEIDRKQQGPVSASHLVSAHQSGVLPESALVWNETLTDWEPLSRHLSALQAELQGAGDRSTEALATQRMAVCAFSGKVMPQADMIASAAFDEEKRTLHDHICGTRVVKK